MYHKGDRKWVEKEFGMTCNSSPWMDSNRERWEYTVSILNTQVTRRSLGSCPESSTLPDKQEVKHFNNDSLSQLKLC